MIRVIAILLATFTSAHAETGIASWYGGGRTANGEHVNSNAFTAAHKTLPFGSMVRVTNVRTGHSIIVRINDRGPFIRGRIIDLTRAGTRALDMDGLALVTVERLR